LLDDEALLAQMHRKTRYNARLAHRRGFEFRRLEPTRENLEQFYVLMRDTSLRNKFGIHCCGYYDSVLQYFGKRALLLGAFTADGELAAALIAARFGAEAIYLYGASSTEYRSHGCGIALQVEA